MTNAPQEQPDSQCFFCQTNIAHTEQEHERSLEPDSQAGDGMSSDTNNLRAIMETLVKHFASLEEDSDGPYWWGHDTNLGDQSEAFDEAIAAVLALLPEKRERQVVGHEYNGDGMVTMYGQTQEEIDGYNEAIDQTRRNLIGEQQ